MSKLLTFNPVYKPFTLPWCFEAWKQHEQMHWLPEEVPLSEDVRDWQKSVTESERNLLTQIFRFFTQQDILVGGAYVDHYLKVFQPTEVRMMLQGFAAREAIHVAAYAHLLDTIGIPEVEYSAFMEYAQMKDKFEYAQQFNVSTPKDIAKSLAVFSAFMEGLQLFASFAMLMNFPRFNKMKGMGQIVAWSIRDESCFDVTTEILTDSGWKFFKDLTKEDQVAQYDNGKISFVLPSHYTEKEVDEDLVGFHNQQSSINQLITKDHRVPFWDEHHNEQRELTAEEFNPHSRKRFITSGLKVDGIKGNLLPIERLLIALQADGSIPKGEYRNGNQCGYRRVTFNLTKQRKKDRLVAICREGKFNFTQSENKNGSTNFYVNIPVEYLATKLFTDWVNYKDINVIWAKEFIEEIVEWDGHKIESSNNRYYYSSVNEDNVIVVQTIAALAGYHTNKKVQKDFRKDTYQDVHRLYITKDKDSVRTGATVKEYIPYKGKVYCVTVPSGFIMVKRNDCIVISGNCHVENMIKLFRAFIQEHPEIWTDEFKKELYDICRQMVDHEDKFIDLAFELGGVEGMDAKDIKEYIRFIADRRLLQLGLKANYGIEKNPLIWLDEMLSAPEYVNFFEQRSTEYSRSAMTGSWDEAYAHPISSQRFEVFGQDGCPWCLKAVELLDKYGLDYTYVSLEQHPKEALYNLTGMKTVPIIYKKQIGSEKVLLGGYTDLEKYLTK